MSGHYVMTLFLFCELLANVIASSGISIQRSKFDVVRSDMTPRRDDAMCIGTGNSCASAYKFTVCGLVLLTERSSSCGSPTNRKKIY